MLVSLESPTWLVCTPMQMSSNGLNLKSLDLQGSWKYGRFSFCCQQDLITNFKLIFSSDEGHLSVNPGSFTFLSKSGNCREVGSDVHLQESKLQCSGLVLETGSPPDFLREFRREIWQHYYLIISPIQFQFERGRGPEVRKRRLQALVAETVEPLIGVTRDGHLSILPLAPNYLEDKVWECSKPLNFWSTNLRRKTSVCLTPASSTTSFDTSKDFSDTLLVVVVETQGRKMWNSRSVRHQRTSLHLNFMPSETKLCTRFPPQLHIWGHLLWTAQISGPAPWDISSWQKALDRDTFQLCHLWAQGNNAMQYINYRTVAFGISFNKFLILRNEREGRWECQ